MGDSKARVYRFGEFRVDVQSRLLLKADGKQVPLTPKIFDTLAYLVTHAGPVIDKTELMQEIWPDTIVEENNLNKNISVLRRVLGEKQGENRYIVTVPGTGYKFVAQVAEETLDNESKVANGDHDGGSEVAEVRESSPAARRKKILFFLGLASLVAAVAILYFWLSYPSKKPYRTIAVLPFKSLVADDRDDVLEMGMADTLIARLSDSRDFVVRPLSSVRKFGGSDQDPLAAGRELGVETVLDGSIQRSADKIRVNVRLLSTADGSSLWSDTFDQRYTDIFAVQDAISSKVYAALTMKVDSGLEANTPHRSTNNFEAYRLYLEGRYHTLKSTPPEIRKGITFYQQAIELEPRYALAYAGLADAYRILPITSDVEPKVAFEQARAASESALAIEPNLAEAMIVLGYVRFWYDRDWSGAENDFKKAIGISPNNSEAHRAYAILLTCLGRHDEALTEIRSARQLDPLSLVTNALEGQALFYSGNYEQAITHLNKTFEIEPHFWIARLQLARIYIEQGRYVDAVAQAEIAEKYSNGNSEAVSLQGFALARDGKETEARSKLNELLLMSKSRYVPAYNIAMIENGLGESDRALSFLERALAEHDARMILLKVDPKWNNLRGRPRFIEFMRQMNFE